MFHEGERFISPTGAPPRAPVSVGQTKTIESQHTEEEMSYAFLLQTQTCMVVEMLDRERPSRSESRLEETADGWEFAGVGETTKMQRNILGSWMQ